MTPKRPHISIIIVSVITERKKDESRSRLTSKVDVSDTLLCHDVSLRIVPLETNFQPVRSGATRMSRQNIWVYLVEHKTQVVSANHPSTARRRCSDVTLCKVS